MAALLGRDKAVKGWIFSSSSGSGTYETLEYPDGTTSCNCMGWTRRVAPDGSRMCKHTRMVDDGRADEMCEKISFDRRMAETLEKDMKSLARMKEEAGVKEAPVEKKKPAGMSDAAKTELLKTAKMVDRVTNLFNGLREYGFIAYQGVMNTRETGRKFALASALKRSANEIPVAGIVWTDREAAKRIRHDWDEFKLHYEGFKVDSYEVPKVDVLRWVIEMLPKYGLKQISSPRVDDFLKVGKA